MLCLFHRRFVLEQLETNAQSAASLPFVISMQILTNVVVVDDLNFFKIKYCLIVGE